MRTLPLTGGCQCGQVRYRVTEAPVRLVACHCRECQRQSGSAFGMSLLVPERGLEVTGETRRFTRRADSGNDNTGVFCPQCGVRIYNVARNVEGLVSLKPGTLDHTRGLKPDYFVWLQSAQGWVPVPEGVTALQGQSR
jgi:hypothetical protein